jgi:hypothetical protein
MSGGNVPYQLRPNKFVDRQLFIEVLEHVGKTRNLKKYVYVSMGGRFLSDFRLIHSRLGVKRLVSFEVDLDVYDRQVFNRPFTTIQCFNQNSGYFVTNFTTFSNNYTEQDFIIWLDYTSPKERQDQLTELQALVSKLSAFDVIKVTFNANKEAPPKTNSGTGNNVPLERLEEQIGDYFPETQRGAANTNEEFAKALALAAKKAILDGIAGAGDLIAIPLAIFRYSDGPHQMLTVSAILVPRDAEQSFLDSSRLSEYAFFSGKWEDVTEISVPDLSIKERMFIDEMLFDEPIEQLHARLPFKFDQNPARSLFALRQYRLHYQRYPSFVHTTT